MPRGGRTFLTCNPRGAMGRATMCAFRVIQDVVFDGGELWEGSVGAGTQKAIPQGGVVRNLRRRCCVRTFCGCKNAGVALEDAGDVVKAKGVGLGDPRRGVVVEATGRLHGAGVGFLRGKRQQAAACGGEADAVSASLAWIGRGGEVGSVSFHVDVKLMAQLVPRMMLARSELSLSKKRASTATRGLTGIFGCC